MHSTWSSFTPSLSFNAYAAHEQLTTCTLLLLHSHTQTHSPATEGRLHMQKSAQNIPFLPNLSDHNSANGFCFSTAPRLTRAAALCNNKDMNGENPHCLHITSLTSDIKSLQMTKGCQWLFFLLCLPGCRWCRPQLVNEWRQREGEAEKG